MEAKYFNAWESKQAISAMETDPYAAKILFEEYIQKYPKDYSTYPFYCSTLIMLGEFDAAEKVLNYVKSFAKTDKAYNQFEKTGLFYENVLFGEIKLLCYQKKYEELYHKCVNNKYKIGNRNLNSMIFYAKKKTGRLELTRREGNSYSFRQIISYNEDDFFDHIQKHLSDPDKDIKEKNTNVFIPDFPIKKVIEEIKKHIPSDKKLYPGFYDNVYYFKYNGCGRENGRLINYIKVVCFHETTDIITICPIVGDNNLPHVDLSYLMNNEEKVKVKKISQIDKFNQRFNRN